MPTQIRIAVVGLRFGANFVPIYQRHPDVDEVGICEPNEALLASAGDRFGIEQRFSNLNDVLKSGRFDAVHIVTPVPLHVEQTLAVLNGGLHCACAVPMATDLDSILRIIAAQKSSGKNYMMMETAAYTREYLLAKEMHDRGEFGNLTLLRGTYYQDLEGAYARYWRAQPPMHYATHVVAPLLALTGTRASKVCCFGSGRLRDDIKLPGGNMFPVQTAIMQLAGSDAAAEVAKSWYQTARPYTESFSVYGDKRGFEWTFEHEDPFLFTLEPLKGADEWGRHVSIERVHPPDRADLLPEEIRSFTQGGHGGSHPHLVHEFVRSIVEQRPPAIDIFTSADWCAPGICADESARKDGEAVMVPDYRSG